MQGAQPPTTAVLWFGAKRGDQLNGRCYFRRPDVTRGLILGGAHGGWLGNSVGYGYSRTLTPIFGAGAGAALGREVSRGLVRCRCFVNRSRLEA